MAYFQIPLQSRPYTTRIGGTRAYISTSFGRTERIILQIGKQAKLEIGGLTASSATPTIHQVPLSLGILADKLFNSSIPTKGFDVVTLSNLSGGGANRSLTITGTRPGNAALYVDGKNPLLVMVGDFQNHTGMEHDLIADAFRRSDLAETHVLSQMLFNDVDNLFNELSTYNKRWGKPLPCGTVSKVGGAAVFDRQLEYTYEAYYNPPVKDRSRDAIRYDPNTLEKGLKALQARLAKGQPSIVGMVYDISSAVIVNGRVQTTKNGGHSVPVVGCSKDGKKFLYIDVYPGGSKLKYTGSFAGTSLFPQECTYLGEFELINDPGRGIDILRSSLSNGGSFSGSGFLEVIEGPLSA